MFDLLTTRFLSGEATGDEQRRLQSLLQTPKLKALFLDVQRRWQEAKPQPVGGFKVKTGLKRLDVGMAAEKSSRPAKPQRRKRSG